MINEIKKSMPLIHCITNYVTVNDVANMLLAAGAAPIMADEFSEVEDITSICQALVINIGTLQARTLEAMILAGKKANELGRPVIFDPVGIGASRFRLESSLRILHEISCDVIRGNISEIRTLYGIDSKTKGVDAMTEDAVKEENLDEAILIGQQLSKSTGAVIAMTGAIDVVTDPKRARVIRNGHPMMSKITGTGCMLDGVIAAFVAVHKEDSAEAVASAIAAHGLCGEIAYEKMTSLGAGTSSMRMYLIDAMSKMDDYLLHGGMKIEVR